MKADFYANHMFITMILVAIEGDTEPVSPTEKSFIPTTNLRTKLLTNTTAAKIQNTVFDAYQEELMAEQVLFEDEESTDLVHRNL